MSRLLVAERVCCAGSILLAEQTAQQLFPAGFGRFRMRGLFARRNLYIVSGLRLIVVPLLTVLAFLPFPFARGDVALITLVAAATPVASSTAIFAQKFGQDYRQAVTYVCLSTVLSIVTLPLVMLLAEHMLA